MDEVKAGHALRGEVVDEVLHPGEVGVVVPRFARDMQGAFGFLECAAAQGSLGRDAALMNGHGSAP